MKPRKTGLLAVAVLSAAGCATATPKTGATAPTAASATTGACAQAGSAPSARIFADGSGRIATVGEALTFLDGRLGARRNGAGACGEALRERTDANGNQIRARIREFDDGSVVIEEETVDVSGLLVRYRVYDDSPEGVRSGIRIEHPEPAFQAQIQRLGSVADANASMTE